MGEQPFRDQHNRAARLARQPGVLAWVRLARVFATVDRASAELLRPWDLSVAQFDILAHLAADEGTTQQQLADTLLVTKGNVSQVVSKMERRGLVRRGREGRVRRLSLTDAGRTLAREVVPALEALIAERLAVLTPAEQRDLLALLRKLDQGLGGRAHRRSQANKRTSREEHHDGT